MIIIFFHSVFSVLSIFFGERGDEEDTIGSSSSSVVFLASSSCSFSYAGAVGAAALAGLISYLGGSTAIGTAKGDGVEKDLFRTGMLLIYERTSDDIWLESSFCWSSN